MLARRHEEEGAVMVLTALLLFALVAASAVAVDLGRTAASSRDQQGATDRAALDAVLSVASADPLVVRQAALESLERNLGLSDGLSSARSYEVDPVACGTGSTPTLTSWSSADGVEVTTTSTVRSLFLGSTSTIERRAVACVRAVGAVSAASTTASLDNGLLNDLLSALLGGSVDLDLVGYRGVAAANIDLAVLATEVSVGSVDELLTTELTAAQLITASAAALEAGNPDAVAVGLATELRELEPIAVGLPPILLGEVLALETGAESAGATLGVDALELVMAGLQLANKDHAVELDLSVAGDLLPITLTVIEPPVIAVGRPGRAADGTWRTEARTAQVELAVGLPVGQVDSSTTGTLDSDQAARIADYRSRIAEAGSKTVLRTIGEELEAELEAVRTHLNEQGYGGLVGLVDGLLSGLTGLLGSILDVLCGRECTRAKMYDAVDDYVDVLGQVNATADADKTSTRPTLTVRTGEGWARLASIGCDDPLTAQVELEARAAHVGLPRTTLLDLGPLGEITIELDTSLGTGASPTSFGFTAPFPTAAERHGGSTVGLGTVLSSVDTSGSRLLLLPIGQVVSLVTSALGPVLDAVDTAVLAPALELLGADLGVVEGRVLDASCSSRSLVR